MAAIRFVVAVQLSRIKPISADVLESQRARFQSSGSLIQVHEAARVLVNTSVLQTSVYISEIDRQKYNATLVQ